VKVTVHFCKSEDLGGRILRLFLMSKWNHVAIQVGDAVYEAVSWGGVIRRPYSQFAKSWHRVASVEVEVAEPLTLYKFLSMQLGKPYDWKAILAFPFRGSWQSHEAWFCSELVYEALVVCGGMLPDRLPSNRVTPRDLWVALP